MLDLFVGCRARGIRFGTMGLPSFHAMGLVMQLCYPLVCCQPVAVYAPQYPAPPVVPSPQNIYEIGKMTKCGGLSAVPSMLEVSLNLTQSLKSYS